MEWLRFSVFINGKQVICQLKPKDSAYRLELEFDKIDARQFGVRLSNEYGESVDICFDKEKREFRVDRSKSGVVEFSDMFPRGSFAPLSAAESQRVTIIVDRASVECFTDIAAASNLVFPTESYNRVEIYSVGGSVAAKSEVAMGK